MIPGQFSEERARFPCAKGVCGRNRFVVPIAGMHDVGTRSTFGTYSQHVVTSEGPGHITADGVARSQRAWARIAGLMYWSVLRADLTGLQLHSSVGRWLMFAGSLLTVPLAFGLYYALRPAGQALASGGLWFRLLEAALGLLSAATGFAIAESGLIGSSFGRAVLKFVHWNDGTAFGAFVFTIGSTIFYLFVKSGYIPPVFAWLGLLASVIAMQHVWCTSRDLHSLQ